MALQQLAPSLRSSVLSSTPTTTSNWVCNSCRRHQTTFRRTRKALRVKPAATFLPATTETADHIIFNPPSSAPNVYHTPQKFLPKTDPRRKLHTLVPAPSTPQPSPSTLAPIRPQYEKKYHLSPEQVEEIRRLRKEDPRVWTRAKLAEKFECSQFFVSLCCCAPEIKAEREKELAGIKEKWGRRKREAREDRQTRNEGWGRDS